MKGAVAETKRRNAGLIIVDTLSQFCGISGDSENSTGAAMEAMRPLQEATGNQNLAVIIARHERKSGGEIGDSGRGASAFSGAVDIVLALRQGEGNSRPAVRVLHALSRFEETPTSQVIERTEDGYVSLGDQGAVAAAEARRAILDVSPATQDQAKTAEELLKAAGELKRTVGLEAIKYLHDSGALQRLGRGKRGDPFRYWRTSARREDEPTDIDSSATTGSTERNSGGRWACGDIDSSGTTHPKSERMNPTCSDCGAAVDESDALCDRCYHAAEMQAVSR